ncbi:MAG: PBP1A family penicillin-binding protein [Alphaproteobacteria bacterium]
MEPTFGSGRAGEDLRLSPEDRAYPIAEPPARSRKRRAEPVDEPPPPPKKARLIADDPPRRPRRRGFMGTLVIWGLTLSVWGIIAIAGIIAWYAASLPPTHTLEVPRRPPTISILSASGAEIATRGDMGGAAVQLKSLPLHVSQALIAIEDRRFYSHFGIDVIGLARAAYTNLTQRGVAQGGSTLTQQLAKNLFLAPDRTFGRKVQEAVLALWLERNYSKADILELYLNRVYFGAGAYGIEAAARRYYDKPATALTLAEAATIAGLVKAPSRLAPTRNPGAAEARAQLVLTAMNEQGFISDAEAKNAIASPASARVGRPGGSINYVADWVMDLMDDHVGTIDTDVLVETTIDPTVQFAAESVLAEELNKGGRRFDVRQGAVVILDLDGAVRALVGGRDYQQSQFNRAVAAKRQPGSAFKAFVYLAAIEHGLMPDTLRLDAPVAIRNWRPENYTRDFRGEVTLTAALSASLNTVAVRLGQEVGPRTVVRTAQRLGIGSRLEANPSIALGTSEVSLIELVGAYAPFANGGLGVLPHVITKVRTTSGRVLYTRSASSPGRVVDLRHVAMMNAMMHETTATGTARALKLPGWVAAGKTGTSQDFRDAWFIGYTGRYIGGVWLGNDDGAPTKRLGGSGMPVDIWSRVMAKAHERERVVDLPGPWRSFQPSRGRGLPGEIFDQPMVMSRVDGQARRSASAQAPVETEDRGAVIRPQPGQGIFDRIFR